MAASDLSLVSVGRALLCGLDGVGLVGRVLGCVLYGSVCYVLDCPVREITTDNGIPGVRSRDGCAGRGGRGCIVPTTPKKSTTKSVY